MSSVWYFINAATTAIIYQFDWLTSGHTTLYKYKYSRAMSGGGGGGGGGLYDFLHPSNVMKI